jgi:hypothetical protein
MKTLRSSFSIFLVTIFLTACVPVLTPATHTATPPPPATFTRIPTFTATPPGIVCTPPACEGGQLVCGVQNGCPGGCGTVCQPYISCTAPACAGGQLVCGSSNGCPGGCGTVCEITGLTPMPEATVILDFAAQLCSAKWMNGGQNLKSCPSENADRSGGLAELADPIPLSLPFDTLVLRTIPAWNGFSSLFLRYPALTLEGGDRFQTVLTCDATYACDVQFALEYYDTAGKYHSFMAWDLKSREAPISVDVSLQELAGQKVDLVLTLRVFHSLDAPNQDNGLWISPRIVRAGQ